jgi:pyruvate dehydrogenase phosphatase
LQLPEPFNPPYTTPLPEIMSYRINPIEDKESFLILDSDGLWDMMSDQEAVDVVANAIRNGENASSALLRKAFELSNFDGISVAEKINSAKYLTPKIRRLFFDDTSIIVVFFRPTPDGPLLDENILPPIPIQPENPPSSFIQITERLQDYLPAPSSSVPI